MPGRGFLLNNELTDFSFAPAAPGRTRPEPAGARQAPAVLDLADDRARLARPAGPGGRLTGRRDHHHHRAADADGTLDRGLPLVDAIAAPRASQRNAATTELEPALWNSPLRGELEALGHAFTQNPEIGAATGVERLPDGRWLAAAETVRRGGGSAMVVRRAGGQ